MKRIYGPIVTMVTVVEEEDETEVDLLVWQHLKQGTKPIRHVRIGCTSVEVAERLEELFKEGVLIVETFRETEDKYDQEFIEYANW